MGLQCNEDSICNLNFVILYFKEETVKIFEEETDKSQDCYFFLVISPRIVLKACGVIPK